MRHLFIGFSTAVALALLQNGALAQDQPPSIASDPVALLQSVCVDHKASFDDVLAYAKSHGWRLASEGGFPIPGAFQETAILQSADTTKQEGVLLYVGHANFPNQAWSDVCLIGVRPGNYDDIRAKIQAWVGIPPEKQNPVGVIYLYQEIGGTKKSLLAATDAASREAAFKNGPVLSVSVAHLSALTMVSYTITGPN